MIAIVLDFLNRVANLASINSTFIVLIPKVSSPENDGDFHPISLCNVVSKLIVNHFKYVLPSNISKFRSVFVANNNVLVAYETLHAMKQ